MSTRNSDAAGAVTVATLREMKRTGEKIACLTAYDASFASLVDAAGVDVILVGDSLGMVVQGLATTIPVTTDDIVYHSKLVSRGRKRALLMADMAFMSFATLSAALDNAARLMQEGFAHMVKLEGVGNQAESVRQLTTQGIPVCAHIGLKPQSVHKLGGYRVQGRDERAATAMMDEARTLIDAGADMLLLECVPSALAKRITDEMEVPVIGIGAGPHCDGQILVLYDMLGITPGKRLRFTKDFLLEHGTVADAIKGYVEMVKSGEFPSPQHSFD